MFGVDWGDPETLWLNVTNLSLGIITLLAVLLVAAALFRELLDRRRVARDVRLAAGASTGSLHILPVPELGLTMADGGEPIERPAGKTTGQEHPGK